MIDIDVGISGDVEVRAQIEALRQLADPAQIDKALRAGGAVFKGAIEERTPVRVSGPSGDALPPGAVKADIHVKSVKDEAGNPAVLVGPSAKTARVMRWLEFGHRQVRDGSKLGRLGRAIGLGGKVTQVPAHPVMRPAFEASQSRALRVTLETLWASVWRK